MWFLHKQNQGYFSLVGKNEFEHPDTGRVRDTAGSPGRLERWLQTWRYRSLLLVFASSRILPYIGLDAASPFHASERVSILKWTVLNSRGTACSSCSNIHFKGPAVAATAQTPERHCTTNSVVNHRPWIGLTTKGPFSKFPKSIIGWTWAGTFKFAQVGQRSHPLDQTPIREGYLRILASLPNPSF